MKRVVWGQVHHPLPGGLGSVMQITSLVLIRKFQTDWLKILLLGEAATPVRLGIMFWFVAVGLSTSDSILDLFLFLFNILCAILLYHLVDS